MPGRELKEGEKSAVTDDSAIMEELAGLLTSSFGGGGQRWQVAKDGNPGALSRISQAFVHTCMGCFKNVASFLRGLAFHPRAYWFLGH